MLAALAMLCGELPSRLWPDVILLSGTRSTVQGSPDSVGRRSSRQRGLQALRVCWVYGDAAAV